MSTETPSDKPARAGKTHLITFGAAIALAIGMIGSTLIAAGTWKDVRKRPEKNNIRITGSAKKRIVSDLIEWSAAIEAQAPERIAAYVDLKAGTEKAVAFLKAQGIKVDEIETQSASIEEEFETVYEDRVLPGTTVPMRTQTQKSKGFRATQTVSIRSADIKLVEKASREITTLLEQGVSVTSNAPRYYYSRLGELKLEMLAEAAKDARSRAENILKFAGDTAVGKLVYADMGIININPANSTATSSEGNNDITSYEKDIITIIRAEYMVR